MGQIARLVEPGGNGGGAQRTALAPYDPDAMSMQTRAHETSIRASATAIAVAEQGRAMVQARALMAMHRPRLIDEARVRLLAHCARPRFAAAAWYKVPSRGEGFSIRFAEAAFQTWGNLDWSAVTVTDTEDVRIIRVAVVDLETNAGGSQDVVLTKTVERRASEGREVIATRQNSKNETTYVVVATEEELLGKQNSAISKARRTLILGLIPADILDECRDAIRDASRGDKSLDPAAARKQMVDAFVSVGVRPGDLVEYLGHALDGCAPHELDDLRGIYAAIKGGETTWREVMRSREPAQESVQEQEPPAEPKQPARRRGARQTHDEPAHDASAETQGAPARDEPDPEVVREARAVVSEYDLDALRAAADRIDVDTKFPRDRLATEIARELTARGVVGDAVRAEMESAAAVARE